MLNIIYLIEAVLGRESGIFGSRLRPVEHSIADWWRCIGYERPWPLRTRRQASRHWLGRRRARGSPETSMAFSRLRCYGTSVVNRARRFKAVFREACRVGEFGGAVSGKIGYLGRKLYRYEYTATAVDIMDESLSTVIVTVGELDIPQPPSNTIDFRTVFSAFGAAEI
jgi:hypothetical protein